MQITEINSIITELEQQKAAVEKVLAALRGVASEATEKPRGRPPGRKNTVADVSEGRRLRALIHHG